MFFLILCIYLIKQLKIDDLDKKTSFVALPINSLSLLYLLITKLRHDFGTTLTVAWSGAHHSSASQFQAIIF